jgi:hypothetical protein
MLTQVWVVSMCIIAGIGLGIAIWLEVLSARAKRLQLKGAAASLDGEAAGSQADDAKSNGRLQQ